MMSNMLCSYMHVTKWFAVVIVKYYTIQFVNVLAHYYHSYSFYTDCSIVSWPEIMLLMTYVSGISREWLLLTLSLSRFVVSRGVEIYGKIVWKGKWQCWVIDCDIALPKAELSKITRSWPNFEVVKHNHVTKNVISDMVGNVIMIMEMMVTTLNRGTFWWWIMRPSG